jgi:hypothetical protein
VNARRRIIAAVCLLLVATPAIARASELLDEVPSDALGFIVIHQLSAFDQKVQATTGFLRSIPFSPLQFLKTAAGVQDGINPNGDLLFVVYPDSRSDKSKLRFAVWLPVADYARFVKSVGGTPSEHVTAVTIAGEDLLVVHHENWALLMDPDERERIAQAASASTASPVASWKSWIEANDVTAVAYGSGIHELVSRVEDAGVEKPAPQQDDLFGAPEAQSRRRAFSRRTAGLGANLLTEFHKWLSASPALAKSIEQATAVGCAIRVESADAGGQNLLAGLRVKFEDSVEIERPDAKIDFPPAISDEAFSVLSAARLPPRVAAAFATAYVQRVAADLKAEEHTELDEESLTQLSEALDQAARDVRSVGLLWKAGDASQPVYSNDFIALRVSSAQDFTKHAAEVMQLWNKANRDADGETKMVFDLEETKVADHAASLYSLDVASTVGPPPVMPDVRRVMEKLFGEGGKMRIWIVTIDDKTVLLAMATQEQVKAAIASMLHNQPINWNANGMAECNRLLPEKADARLFIDPHRYVEWLGHQAMGMTGVPVIGGPIVRPLRDSPAAGVAASLHDQELWVDAAVPAATAKALYSYVLASTIRPEIRVRIQRTPR